MLDAKTKLLLSNVSKVTVNNFLDCNIITKINKGKTDMESFKFVSDECLDNLAAEMEANTNCELQENSVNEKFYETLFNIMIDEVKNAITETGSLKANLNTNSINVVSPECETRKNHLLNILIDQIEFLKGKLKSKGRFCSGLKGRIDTLCSFLLI